MLAASSNGAFESDEGDLVIDFKWLLQRCLDWYEQRGDSVSELAAVLGSVRENALPPKEDGQSDEQVQAIHTMLSTGLCYIWGPPGTGKTTWVLARAVRHCVRISERMLILASTNLAVENALRAILACDVNETLVLRIGMPSSEFAAEHPKCCEERAFRVAREDVARDIQFHERLLGDIRRMRELRVEIATRRDRESALQCEACATSQAAEALRQQIEAIESPMACAQQEATSIQEQMDCCSTEIQSLAYERRQAELRAMEDEHARIIANLTVLRSREEAMPWFARIFTSRLKLLRAEIGKEISRRDVVERSLVALRSTLDADIPRYRQLVGKRDQLEAAARGVRATIAQLRGRLVSTRQEYGEAGAALRRIHLDLQETQAKIEGLERAAAQIELPSPEADLARAEQAVTDTLEALKVRVTGFQQSVADKSVLGMTLDGFIGWTMQNALVCDRVFIDEAPYAPLAKVLPVLSLRRPIAMLGDHLQLPPVIRVKSGAAIRAYWAKSAIHIDEAFEYGNHFAQLNHAPASICLDQRRHGRLTKSFRFGQRLASLLDAHVYRVGLIGNDAVDSKVKCIRCDPHDVAGRQPRQNHAEVEEIMARLGRWWAHMGNQGSFPSIAVLTPYRRQRDLIRRRLRQVYGDHEMVDHVEVLNTHTAQGREWDWVFVSAADTGRLQGNNPYFTDSLNPDGNALLNTTISRAKQRLVVFLDREYWEHRSPVTLLTELALAGD